MPDVAGGRIVWKLDIDESAFASKATAAEAAAGKIGSNVASAGKGFAGFASQASNAFSQVASGLGTILKVGTVVTAGLAIGLGAAAKASLDMVSSVQRSTIALTTYTGSASQAAAITKELIDFAKSPQGVLFNRDELLRATVLLKGAGAETEKLTGYIKAMAPAVAVSGGKFDELAQIMSKVVATGRLDAETFDQLAIRGVVLDKALRGTSITADEFFRVLSQTIDASQLDEYAKTVDGLKTRFKSAFREIGNALLGVQYGVDGLGASFAAGGLGEAASKALTTMTEAFQNPAVVGAITKLGNSIARIVDVVIPLIGPVVQFLAQNLENLVIALASVAAGFVVARGAAIAFGVAATIAQAGAAAPFLLIAAAITFVVIGITALIIKLGLMDDVFKAVGQGISNFKAFLGEMKPAIDSFVGVLVSAFNQIWSASKTAFDTIKSAIQDTFGNVDWSKVFSDALKVVGDAIVFLTPIVAGLIKGVGDFVAWAIRTGAAIYDFLKPAFDVLWQAAQLVWNVFTTMLLPALQSFWETIQPYVPLLQKIALIFGVIIVGSLLLFATIFLLVVGIVIGAVALIVGIISTLSDIWTSTWSGIQSVVSAVWSGIKATVNAGISFVVGMVQQGVSNVKGIWNSIQSIVGTVSNAFNGVVNAVRGGIQNAYNAVSGFIGRFVSLGGDIIDGIVRGILGAAGRIGGALQNIASSALKAAKAAVEAKSPSQLFAREVGMPISQGIAAGILQGAGEINSALSSIPSLNPSVSTSTDIGDISGGRGSATVNNYTIEQSGIMTDSRQGIRRVFEEGIEAANEARRANQQPLIGGQVG